MTEPKAHPQRVWCAEYLEKGKWRAAGSTERDNHSTCKEDVVRHAGVMRSWFGDTVRVRPYMPVAAANRKQRALQAEIKQLRAIIARGEGGT